MDFLELGLLEDLSRKAELTWRIAIPEAGIQESSRMEAKEIEQKPGKVA